MKVLMFGWEFPPYFAGGVGVVCHELVKQLTSQGVSVDYVMPRAPKVSDWQNLRMIDTSELVTEQAANETHGSLSITKVQSLLAAYQTPEEYEATLEELRQHGSTSIPGQDKTGKLYGDDLLQEIDVFARRTAHLATQNYFTDFDVIHAHDWTTVPAATAVKRITGKPLLVHVHITEINKNAGQGVHAQIYETERQGFMAADKILAVSHQIKDTLIQHYGVPGEKIAVVHNANIAMAPVGEIDTAFKGDNQIVSFLGRVTTQKGPLHFVDMAAQVAHFKPNTKFIMGGSGDLLQSCMDRARELGVFDKFYFHGFYNRDDANRFFDMSDVFVLPSLMEPFGVTPLEAMCKETPTIVTKQSGVSEVLNHCYKVDFWDINRMASQVISLLSYPKLHTRMKDNGLVEAQSITWEKPAQLCLEAYQEVLR